MLPKSQCIAFQAKTKRLSPCCFPQFILFHFIKFYLLPMFYEKSQQISNIPDKSNSKLQNPIQYALSSMKQLVANPVKRASSLVLCRSTSRLNSFFNYEVLLLQRRNSHKSWGSVLAFPGGKFQPEKDCQLSKVMGIQNAATATALRQCFQETGIFISQNPLLQTSKISDLTQIKLQYIASQFYKSSINSNAQQFQKQKQAQKQEQLYSVYKKICQIVHPKRKLMPFIRLVTVPLIKSRFDAFFFVHKIQQYKLINFMKFAQNQKHLHSFTDIVMNEQFSAFSWRTPLQVLQDFTQKKVKLAPPQFIMLNILSSFYKFEELQQFLGKCSANWINMGPNIVSMVNNSGYLKHQYPFAATLIGDAQFPYQFCTKSQKNEYLIKQILEAKQKIAQASYEKKNRILFKKPLQFFEQDYQNECNIQDSVMSKFVSSKKLKQRLSLYL